MKTVGIIAEYDPLHCGHAYHLKKARELSGADYVIAVMSPDFTQRGEPALIDKWIRAGMALEAGADLVLELPVRSAAGSAEFFAGGGVRLLDSLGCVDALSFGCEEADKYELLRQAARFFAGKEPEAYQTALRNKLREGVSFPRARAQAFASLFEAGRAGRAAPGRTARAASDGGFSSGKADNDCDFSSGNAPYAGFTPDEIMDSLAMPNNILAIEYMKAAIRLGSPMKMIPVKRLGDYHQGQACAYTDSSDSRDNLQDADNVQTSGRKVHPGGFSSASAIRTALLEHNMILPERYISQLPSSSLALLSDELKCGRWVVPGDLDLLLHHELLDMRGRLQEFADIDEDLSNRIDRYLNQYTGFMQFAALIQSKQYTLARIRRSLLHVLLRIRKDEKPALCARVLGFRKTAQPLLRQISAHSLVPLSTGIPFSDIPNEDIYASHLWEMIVTNKTGRRLRHERQRQIIVM